VALRPRLSPGWPLSIAFSRSFICPGLGRVSSAIAEATAQHPERRIAIFPPSGVSACKRHVVSDNSASVLVCCSMTKPVDQRVPAPSRSSGNALLFREFATSVAGKKNRNVGPCRTLR
jgi:hypothetical protein